MPYGEWYITDEGYSGAYSQTLRGEFQPYENGKCPRCHGTIYRQYEGFDWCPQCDWDNESKEKHRGI